jgi:major membrane immunogen (membrane-anchored lipoprotein)
MKYLALTMVVLSCIVLSGCGRYEDDASRNNPHEVNSIDWGETDITLEDGRTVHCIHTYYDRSATLDCDWNSAKEIK